MTDIFDQATEHEIRDREMAIKLQLDSAAPAMRRTGHCHNCDESLRSGGLFCDADCLNDYELRARAKRF